MKDVKKEILSLGQAAKIADCSRDTIRRAAQRQELEAKMGPGKRGPQWWVREADLLDWIQNRNQGAQQAEHSKSAAEQSTASSASKAQQVSDADYVLVEPSEEGDSEGEYAELSTAAEEVIDFDSRQVSVEVHQAVISELVDELRRADRQMIALQMQLSQNKNLLAERSESLLQREAEEKAQAEREAQLESQKAEHAQQAQQAQQELELAQAELAALKTEMASKEAEWAEQRKPWYQKLFRRSS